MYLLCEIKNIIGIISTRRQCRLEHDSNTGLTGANMRFDCGTPADSTEKFDELIQTASVPTYTVVQRIICHMYCRLTVH